MAAQGSLFIFLALIWFYNRKMRKVDGELGIADE
jgi:putative solute:sodium symporter small subunit